ncbi:MAG: ATP-dependent helicase HrpB [Blastocatellia bacterium]
MTPLLPIDSLLPEIVSVLRSAQNLVIEAPPGAGKTTRVPPALLRPDIAGDGEVWVLEPRRLAARMSARRVAGEMGERLGETVGYQVRFEEISGPRTRLRFLTEGVLTRRLLSDPQLARVAVVILDEFHERHLQADMALALLKRLQQTTRPDLKLIAMSATLDAAPVAAFLDDCPVLRSEGRRFDVAIEHAPRHDERPLELQVAEAVKKVIAEHGPDSDMLVFLPGAAEIRRAMAACDKPAKEAGLLLLPLHGDMPAAEQDRVVQPADRPKIILSTNVAESSLTIDGVTVVIDAGLARMASHSPWSGLPMLQTGRISKAAAAQRAGRAGRTRPGRCLRLYTAQDFAARPDYETPEIRRADLAEPLLELHAAGINDPAVFTWFEAPATPAIEAAENLLQRLGAIDGGGAISETGRRMLRYPAHPRQARLLVEARDRGVFGPACAIAALLGERDIRQGNVMRNAGGSARSSGAAASGSDLLRLLDLFDEAARTGFAPDKLRALGLDAGAVQAVERVRRQLAGSGKYALHADDDALLLSILTGYPDRVARRRGKGDPELLLSTGGAATLGRDSVTQTAEFVVAVDIEERRETGRRAAGAVMIRLASEIRADWLLDLYSDRISEVTDATWNAQSERVEASSRLLYDQLVIDESRNVRAAGPVVAQKLAEAARQAGLRKFLDEDDLANLLARIAFVARTFPEAGITPLTPDNAKNALEGLCENRRSFAELRQAFAGGEFHHALQSRLTPEQTALIARMAPERVSLAGRRNVRVHYETDRAPWIASRMQDFFGMTAGPVIASGRVPLVLHLLAPNQRPVQVTTDLAGFWQRTWPQTRRELMRRYPRHAWPEKPMSSM